MIAKKIIFVDKSFIFLDATPTFSLASERSFDGSPKINIVFPNGKSDSMILMISDSDLELREETGIDECRYMGYLEKDPEACLAMTGCPGIEDVHFTILSDDPESSGLFVWRKDGKVETSIHEVTNCKWTPNFDLSS